MEEIDSSRPAGGLQREVTLVETLDHLLNQGVVVVGDVTLSVADVDLIYMGLRLLLCSVESAGSEVQISPRPPLSKGGLGGFHARPATAKAGVRGAKGISASKASSKPPEELLTAQTPPAYASHVDRPNRINADPEKAEHGLLKLVLTVVELLRRLMEQQALRRVEAGSLTPEEIERMGVTFLRLEEKMTELLAYFHLREEDLTLSLGPLGELM